MGERIRKVERKEKYVLQIVNRWFVFILCVYLFLIICMKKIPCRCSCLKMRFKRYSGCYFYPVSFILLPKEPNSIWPQSMLSMLFCFFIVARITCTFIFTDLEITNNEVHDKRKFTHQFFIWCLTKIFNKGKK